MKKNIVGERIKILRETLGFTQVDFAENLGITRGILSKMEIGDSIPTFDTLKKIYTVFDVSADYFFEEGHVLPGGYFTKNTFSALDGMNKSLDGVYIRVIDEPNIDETITLSKLGAKYKKYVKNDIGIHHKHLSEILKSLDRITDLSEILNDFLPIISIENIEDVSIYKKLIKDLPANSPIRAAYDIYKIKTIEYLKSLLPYKAPIATFEKQLMDFLKKMKDLDKNNEIHLPEE